MFPKVTRNKNLMFCALKSFKYYPNSKQYFILVAIWVRMTQSVK